MKIVAGYFDSEDEATRAMDMVLQDPMFRNAESEVISSIASGSEAAGDTGVVPVVPHTSGGMGSSTVIGQGPVVPVTGGAGRRLFRDLDRAEAEYFGSAMKNGQGVLALVKVEDEHAMHVRQVFSQNGARTYQE